MKKNQFFPICLSFISFFVLIAFSSCISPQNGGESHVPEPEFVYGDWISSVSGDFPAMPTRDSISLQAQCDKILEEVSQLGFNTIFFQVRPSADALYKSKLFPWSKGLTGELGLSPDNDFDPLAYMTKEAHKRGIQIHAWINPYRIKTYGKKLSLDEILEKSPALKKLKKHILSCKDGNFYLDPGSPKVRKFIVRGAREIIENYDVDGIHIDDYFYPEAGIDDSATFKKYGGGKEKSDWRRENVNILIRELNEAVHKVDSDLKFGVSPAGIWANKSEACPEGSQTRGRESRNALFADSLAWVKNEWLDYIIPQIYWERGHKPADYTELSAWWNKAVEGSRVRLYIGMADYKATAAKDQEDSVWYGKNEIQGQSEANKLLDNVKGEVHFNHGSIVKNPELVEFYKNRIH